MRRPDAWRSYVVLKQNSSKLYDLRVIIFDVLNPRPVLWSLEGRNFSKRSSFSNISSIKLNLICFWSPIRARTLQMSVPSQCGKQVKYKSNCNSNWFDGQIAVLAAKNGVEIFWIGKWNLCGKTRHDNVSKKKNYELRNGMTLGFESLEVFESWSRLKVGSFYPWNQSERWSSLPIFAGPQSPLDDFRTTFWYLFKTLHVWG